MNNLDDINDEIKRYVNEATFISDKVLKRVLTLISKYFYVDLPVDNYLRVDIKIKENGNIIMKGEEYKTTNEPKNIEEVYKRYEALKEKLELIVNKKEVNFDKKRTKNDFISFLITLGLTIVFILIIIYSMFQLLRGNIYGFIWMLIVVVPILTPKIQDRYAGAIRFIKNLFKK